MRPLLPTILLATALTLPAQVVIKPFPKVAVAARTVAIVNNTHQDGVIDGATDAIKRWGHFTIVDDSDTADITLVFDKKSEHERTSTQKTGDDGKPESTFSMTFGSSIHMHALVKGDSNAFYSTTSSDSKKKAGEACVLALQHAYLDNR